MTELVLTVAGKDVIARMRERLRPNAATPAVVWQDKSDRVLIHADSLNARFVDGWLVASLDLQSDQTGRQALQFVYFIGSAAEGPGLNAGATVNAATPQAALLAER